MLAASKHIGNHQRHSGVKKTEKRSKVLQNNGRYFAELFLLVLYVFSLAVDATIVCLFSGLDWEGLTESTLDS